MADYDRAREAIEIARELMAQADALIERARMHEIAAIAHMDQAGAAAREAKRIADASYGRAMEVADEHVTFPADPASSGRAGHMGPLSEPPRRIQLSRKRGWRMPEGAVKVDRTTAWGNPFRVGESIASGSELWPYFVTLPGVRGLSSVKIVSAQLAVDLFSCWFIEQPQLMTRAFEELPGRDLACWCRPGAPCHGDWLLGMVNAPGAVDA